MLTNVLVTIVAVEKQQCVLRVAELHLTVSSIKTTSDAKCYFWEIMSLVKANRICPSCKLVDGTEKQKNIRLLVSCCRLTISLNRS
jgi:hypothetical protein